MKRFWLWVPLGMFMLFFGVVANGLMHPTDPTVTSKMVGKRLPAFALPAATAKLPGLESANLRDGKPKLVNIFASWCIPCAAESPVLIALAQNGAIIEGIAIRDRPQDLNRFLARNGNPYRRIGSDVDSKVQMSFGSSGVPETFLVDGRGIVRHQYVGDLQEDDVPEILDALRAAR